MKQNAKILEMKLQGASQDTKLQGASSSNYHFAVYKHRLITKDGQQLSRLFIVIKDSDNDIVAFTDFHLYARGHARGRRLSEDGNKRSSFVCVFLNYIYNERGVSKLNDITIDMLQDFLTLYGTGKLGHYDNTRTKETTMQCYIYVVDFLKNYIKKNPDCCLSLKDFIRKKPVQTKNGQLVYRDVPSVNFV